MLVDDDRAFAFLNSLQQQLEFYNLITELSTRQNHLLSIGDEKRLFDALAQKQSYIDKIDELSAQFQKERELCDQAKMGEFSNIDEEIDTVLAELETVIKDIIEKESQDLESLKAQQQNMNEKMSTLQKGKGLVNAYRAQASAEPKKMNRKG